MNLAVIGLVRLAPATTSRWSITVIYTPVDRNGVRAEDRPGIEYGDMQLIAEAYDILRRGLGLPNDEIADIFSDWNKGVLDSFLIDITANILKFKDDDGEFMVEKILDSAGQKGTGKWTAIASLEAGIPGKSGLYTYPPPWSSLTRPIVTLIGEAVFARCLSSLKQERVRASKVISGPQKEAFRGDKKQFIDDLEQALYASKIISYTQGFMLMRQTAKDASYRVICLLYLTYSRAAQLEPELRWYCSHVAWRMHHQGESVSFVTGRVFNHSDSPSSLTTLLLPTPKPMTSNHFSSTNSSSPVCLSHPVTGLDILLLS